MNTSGFIRGYMAKNMIGEEFIKVVVKALTREFENEVLSLNTTVTESLITMGDYRITMGMELIEKLKSPYGIDKYILEELEKQGLVLEKDKSQYIQYCFGNYFGNRQEYYN